VRRRHQRQDEGSGDSSAALHAAVQSPRQAQNTLLLQRTLGNRATQRLIQRDDGTPTTAPPSKTLYMGMNAGSKIEAAKLKGILKDDVIAAMNDPALEKS